MSAVNHRFVLRTHDGEHLTFLQGLVDWELTRVENEAGWFTVTAAGDFNPQWLGVDRLIEFWRRPIGGEETCLAVGFMRYWGWEELADGTEVCRFGGPDQVELLDRRIINYQANTVDTSKTATSDDMLKAIVHEAMVHPRAGTDRYLRPRYYPAANFDCDPDEHAGYMMSRDFAWRDVLPTMQEIAESSYSYGVPLYFDVVPDGVARFMFRTWVNVRGIDRTIGAGVAPILFSKETGNLADPVLRFDYTEELSYVSGGGGGEGPNREIDPEHGPISQMRESESIWNKREAFQDARECARNRPCIAARAFQKLQEHRAKTIFSGTLLDMPQSRFGVDWGFGDKVTARYKGFDFDGHVRSFTIRVSGGIEEISARMSVAEYAYGSPR